MGKLQDQMLELRQLRNAAKGLLRDDVAFLKGEHGGKGIAPRLMDSAGGKARGVAGTTAEVAKDNKLKIGTGVALGIGAFAAWMFRDRIEKTVSELAEFIMDEGEPVQKDTDNGDAAPSPTPDSE